MTLSTIISIEDADDTIDIQRAFLARLVLERCGGGGGCLLKERYGISGRDMQELEIKLKNTQERASEKERLETNQNTI